MAAGPAESGAVPPILVISLVSAADRRAFMARQLDALGLDFRFLDATAVRDIPPADLARLRRLWARPMMDTEVACALSHRRCWEEIAAGDGPVLVLEDDAVLAPDLPAVLRAAGDLRDADCLNLETFAHPKTLGAPRAFGAGGHTLARVHRDTGGAAAYLMWPEGARKVLANLPGFLPLADAAINLTLGLRKWQVEPAPAIQAGMLLRQRPGDSRVPEGIAETTIGSVRTAPKPATTRAWLRYKFRRAIVSVLVARQKLRALGRATRRDVDFSG